MLKGDDMPLYKDLKIGDKVIYDEKPEKVYTIVGFNGRLALLDDMIPTYSILPNGPKENNRFIYKFGVYKNPEKPEYNDKWSLV